MALWGLIVAAALAIGSLPLFVGLAVVIPVLGHSTWHLYRKVVVPDLPPRETHPTPPKAFIQVTPTPNPTIGGGGSSPHGHLSN